MRKNVLLAGVAAVTLATLTWSPWAMAEEITFGWTTGVSTSIIQASPINTSAYVETGGDDLFSLLTTPVGPASVTTTIESSATPLLVNPGVFNSTSLDEVVTCGGGAPTCGGTWTLYITASGLMYPPPALTTNWAIDINANGLDSSTITDTRSVYTSLTNIAAPTTAAIVDAETLIAGPTSVNSPTPISASQPFNYDPAIGYSITEVFTFVFTGSGNADDNVDVNAVSVPEPASLSLLGGALLAFGAWKRRRRDRA